MNMLYSENYFKLDVVMLAKLIKRLGSTIVFDFSGIEARADIRADGNVDRYCDWLEVEDSWQEDGVSMVGKILFCFVFAEIVGKCNALLPRFFSFEYSSLGDCSYS